MSLYWIAVLIFMLCGYIALTVKGILDNQTRLNNARYEQIKKLQEEVIKLRSEIKNIQQDGF